MPVKEVYITVWAIRPYSPGPERVIRRDREIRIFGYFSFFMHARIISERDFQTIHLKIIMHKMGHFMHTVWA